MNYQDFIAGYPTIKNHDEFTENKLGRIRNDLEISLEASRYRDKITIVTMGSYARREASDSSDIDLYILFDSDKSPTDLLSGELWAIDRIIKSHVGHTTGDTGTFGTDAIVSFPELVENIGGEHDRNKTMTRRMLLLLAGEWLFGEARFQDYRRTLLKKYIKEDDTRGHSLSLFLLNDMVRFYRTMATDFEYKVSENNKSWGLRNVKLRFSRKLLYFGGVIAVAEVAEEDQTEKLTNIEKLLGQPVLRRIYTIAPESNQTREIFASYNTFLSIVGASETREELRNLNRADRNNSEIYQRIKDSSQHFSLTLSNWLQVQYRTEHQIHNALLF